MMTPRELKRQVQQLPKARLEEIVLAVASQCFETEDGIDPEKEIGANELGEICNTLQGALGIQSS